MLKPNMTTRNHRSPWGVLFVCTVIYSLINLAPSFCQEKSAVVFSVSGDVKLIPMGSNIGVKCVQGMKVRPMDWIKTGPNAEVTLSFDDKADNVLKVQENTLIVMKLDGYFKIQLLKGQVCAVLENVEKGEVFRTLTPSVVTESTSSNWAVSSEGVYTTVVVVDGEAYVCGLNKDGSVKKEKHNITAGYSRTTKRFEDPGELTATPESVMSWFKQQVVDHHLDKVVAKKAIAAMPSSAASGEKPLIMPDPSAVVQAVPDKVTGQSEKQPAVKSASPVTSSASGKGKNVAIIDGREVDIIEYLYKERLRQTETKPPAAADEGKTK